MYSQSILGKRLKEYLINNIVTNDCGTKMFGVQQHSLSLLNMLLKGGVTFCTHNFVQLINPVTFNLCVDELLLSNGVYEHPNPPVESFTPLLVDHIMDNNNVLFKKPDEDELNGEMRYLNNKMYY